MSAAKLHALISVGGLPRSHLPFFVSFQLLLFLPVAAPDRDLNLWTEIGSGSAHQVTTPPSCSPARTPVPT